MAKHRSTPTLIFRDRRDAGRQLARALAAYRDDPTVLVLALPRGGVPVAAEVAEALGAPLDVLVVRKLGVPGHEELAMGAIASGGAQVLNDEVVRDLRISAEAVREVAAVERQELERREASFRQGREPLAVTGRTVLVVDDGLATGATMRAAVKALRCLNPARLVVAVPVAPADTCKTLRDEADAIVCLSSPDVFFGVGEWYEDFRQTTDAEVRATLHAPGPQVAPDVSHPSAPG